MDKAAHPMTSVTKPAVLGAYVDPEFGTVVRRISSATSGTNIIPAYSTIPAWNSDESYLILYHQGGADAGHHLYDGRTYVHIKKLGIDPVDIEQFYWDTSDPDLIYYVSGSRLYRYHASTDQQEVVHTFNCSAGLTGGSDPMFTSWSSSAKLLGLRCSSQVFAYSFTNDVQGTAISLAGSNAPVATPSGTLAFYNADGAAQVRDLSMNLLRTLSVNGDEHASLGQLSDGTDTHNAVSFDGTYVGSLVTSNLATGASRVVVGPDTGYPYPPTGTHVSAVAYKKPGWVALSIVGEQTGGKLGQGVLDNEIVLANTNSGGKVCRVAHHRSCADACGSIGYFAEPHVVISPSGTRLLFGSDWGGGTTTDTYVVELPSYK